MTIIQIIAIGFGILYLLFATKNKSICFLFGAISSSFWAYESFYNLGLKFDAFLQVFYVIMSIYGAYVWYKGDKLEASKINRLSIKSNLLFIGLGVIISFLAARIAIEYFDLNFAYLDSFTTGFSIIATFLLAQRYFENWIYWLIINPVYIFIYYKSEAPLFAAMSGLYMIMSIYGYLNWRKEMRIA